MHERPRLSAEQLSVMPKEELAAHWHGLQKYVDGLEARAAELDDELKRSRESERLKSLEILKLKNAIVMKYSIGKSAPAPPPPPSKPAEQVSIAKPTGGKLPVCLDPCVSAVVEQLQRELEETRKAKEELQNELQGWKFSAESHMGKRLILKCRKLLQENEELGKLISSDNLAKLEADLAYHKALLSEACENEQNMNQFAAEMDTEMDAMQATIVQLQQVIKSKVAASPTASTAAVVEKPVEAATEMVTS